MADVEVKVTGLNELGRAFKQIDTQLPGALKEGFTKIAESVATDVRAKVAHKSGRAAGSVTARGKQRGAAIAVGGSRAPYYPWLDFGGSVGRGHKPGVGGSGAIKRDMVPDGRYLYPTIAEHNKQIKNEVDQLLERLARQAGFDTKGF